MSDGAAGARSMTGEERHELNRDISLARVEWTVGNYCTDIADAWSLFEEMAREVDLADGGEAEITFGAEGWLVSRFEGGNRERGEGEFVSAWADTAPHAIALAYCEWRKRGETR